MSNDNLEGSLELRHSDNENPRSSGCLSGDFILELRKLALRQLDSSKALVLTDDLHDLGSAAGRCRHSGHGDSDAPHQSTRLDGELLCDRHQRGRYYELYTGVAELA